MKKGGIKMAHEIKSIMWYGDRPWHGLGVEVLQAQTSEEAIVKAGPTGRLRRGKSSCLMERKFLVTLPLLGQWTINRLG